MRNLLVATLFIASASAANAAILSADATRAVGDEMDTVTLFIELEGTEVFRGVDATITGAVNQQKPFGSLATIFTDNNAVFANDPSTDVSRDSQFLFASGDILSIGAEEADGTLKAAISGLVALNLTGKVPFAQVATADASAVDFDFSFDLGGAEPFLAADTLDTLLIPEPSTCILAGLALVGFVSRRK